MSIAKTLFEPRHLSLNRQNISQKENFGIYVMRVADGATAAQVTFGRREQSASVSIHSGGCVPSAGWLRF
jgi:hypothetical protein